MAMEKKRCPKLFRLNPLAHGYFDIFLFWPLRYSFELAMTAFFVFLNLFAFYLFSVFQITIVIPSMQMWPAVKLNAIFIRFNSIRFQLNCQSLKMNK